MVYLYQGKPGFCMQEGVRLIDTRRDHPELHVWGTCLTAAGANALGKYDEALRAYEEMEAMYEGEGHKEKVTEYLGLQVGKCACWKEGKGFGGGWDC